MIRVFPFHGSPCALVLPEGVLQERGLTVPTDSTWENVAFNVEAFRLKFFSSWYVKYVFSVAAVDY